MTNFSLYSDTDADSFYLGYYNPIEIEKDVSDYYFIVTKEFENKPGKLAYSLYGTPRLFWIFAYYNRDLIEDSFTDLKEGLTIRIPSKDRLLSYF